ncbi:cap-specific mRNA (nucleoside-2'-O-)-methyltransferase 1 [Phlebotomus argentipes]|uniref:cap-specific mRNA (nucleoside-2'-O-)-methyltransferase 1 n=1 Tax=Phlebotomus argentipes TaxID=94469 RepID=UPI002892EC8D|nr:cap-specific mRNA (nucleoside-2'-O-)-methyltransferase 1 [Phlebotomus argentipes]
MTSTSDDNSTPEFSDSGYTEGMYGKRKRRSEDENDDSSDEAPAIKKPANTEMYSKASLRMMQKMGYQERTGLGKHSQGRLDPVEASKQKGRRGLGAAPDAVDISATHFDETEEKIQIPEIVNWMYSDADDLEELDRNKLDDWCVRGKRKMTIDDETLFCDPDILKNVLEAKTVFDNMNDLEMRRACQRSNPFETIKNVVFLNRAAVKMANMDALLNFMFTNPVDERGQSLVREHELLYFADVCAGPGGFSEYVLWKRKWHAKGFGFTLREENDFNLDNFLAGHPESFHPYYGEKENGDVYDPANIESLMNLVMQETGNGVHFMMADGGFSVKNQENIQEILSKRLYLCQCLAALSVLREKGHFVVKLFDIFTPFSVGLIYLMYKCFRRVAIIKPNTSRPANSERYLVCKWMKSDTDVIRRHLLDICESMYRSTGDEDIRELVPYEVLREDEQFFKYIFESNNRIGQNQITGLRKIAAYAANKTLAETRQAEIREQCLTEWRLPSAMRTAARGQKISHDEYCNDLLKTNNRSFMTQPEIVLTNPGKFSQHFGGVQDHWFFMALNTPENSQKNYRTFFLSKGRQDVVMLNAKGLWESLPRGVPVEMSPNTLLYGEIVQEHKGQERSQRTTYALHIIDGLILDGEDIRKCPLQERNRLCHKFAEAINKPSKLNNGETSVPIRCKKLIPFREIGPFIDSLEYYALKNLTHRKGYMLPNTDDRFYIPKALLFLCEMKSNLRKNFSVSNNDFYYFDVDKGVSFMANRLPDPNCILASSTTTLNFRLLWKWEQEDQINARRYEPAQTSDDGQTLVFRSDFERFIRQCDDKIRPHSSPE